MRGDAALDRAKLAPGISWVEAASLANGDE
jgi:hypothetical protein